jgi:hypothetical protein
MWMMDSYNSSQVRDAVTDIKDLIERWVICRDALLWDKWRTVWHKGGTMKATWFEGPFEEFMRVTEEGAKRGLNILHILGGSMVEVDGERAVSITKMMISQRAMLESVLCDVSCHARHFDFWEKREGRWGLVRRDTIADKDRIDPVFSTSYPELDQDLLASFPEEYRYLAYLQTRAGYAVDKDVPRTSGGSALESLYARGDAWLTGAS